MVVDATRWGCAARYASLAALALISLLTAVRPAAADGGSVPQFIAPSFAWLAPGLPGSAETWRTTAADAIAPTLCRADRALAGWLALVSVAPSGIDGCRTLRPLRHVTLPIGRQAGVFVAARGGPALRLDAAIFHRALAGGADGGARTWRGVDGRLPDVAVAILLPDADTPSWRLLSAAVLQEGCLSRPSIRRIFDAAERKARCETVRADGAVDRRRDHADVAQWLAARGSGAVAFVSYPEFLALGEAVVPLPFADVLPTVAEIARDRYPVSRTLHLAVGLADPADPGLLRQVLRIAGEETIGPTGTLAGLGIVPLPAAARVELRETLLSLGGAI
ncbi:hypothetical protein [Stella sp.]|uniref:hypothetical protein n=1 Tax=Stella sp. TaxID=2912054 RepID=UPI0035AFA0C4